MPLAHLLRTSLRWRLSLIVCGLLVVVVAAFGALAHREVERTLLIGGRARLLSVADQLSALLAQSSRQRLDEARRVAAGADLRAFLLAPGPATREQALEAVRDAIGQQPTWITVWSSDGAKVLEAAPEAAPAPVNLSAAARVAPSQAGISELKIVNGIPYYDTVAEVAHPEGGVVGHVVASRAFASAAAAELITRLIGSDAVVHLGNRTGEVWTDLGTVVPRPPVDVAVRAVAEYTGEGGVRLVASAPIRDTPWSVVVEFPRAALLAPARTVLVDLAVLALPFVLIAALITRWLMGRVTTPIQDLTSAAETIAAGNYGRRVATGRDDEIGRLGAAFNTMTARVEEGVQRLEARVAERTQELEAALAALRDAQEDAVRREKLAILGQLASGVGHELRNPLGVMTNAVYYLEMIQQDADPEVKEYLGILRGQIGISERIVTDLLDFARVKPPQLREVALAALVQEQLQRLGPPGDGIAVSCQFPPDLPPVFVDQGQVGQIVLNLLTNAVQAMESGGTLTVRGEATADGGVALHVIDTGVGMAPELQQKIFDPLFTTKARGIGLGLAVSRSLTEANSGRLTVESRPGAGTTFSLTLPTPAGIGV